MALGSPWWGRTPVVAASLVGLAVLTAAEVCQADDLQELELAKNRFDAGQYEEAHARLFVMLDAQKPPCDKAPTGTCRVTEPEVVERARVLDATSLIALKRDADANAQIERVLRQNPTYTPSAALYPQELVDRFTEMRGKLRAELDKQVQKQAEDALKAQKAEQAAREAQEKWIAELQRLAGQEKKVDVHSRWLAFVPFGAGQYQNGDVKLGVFFTVSEALLGTTTLVTAGIVNAYANADPTRPCDDTCQAQRRANVDAAALVNRVAFGTLVATALAGIIQAQIAYEPSVATVVQRPVPPRPKVTPTVSIQSGGVGLGIVGSF
jgi:hypothetical protein